MNSANNIRTIGFLAHCKERQQNLTFSVESCTVIIPANAVVPRTDDSGNTTYVSLINEPYIYVRMMPIGHAEGDLVYSNNPEADAATFVMWCDKIHLGTNDQSPPQNFIDRPNEQVSSGIVLNAPRWISYKSCMITVMRLNLQADEWQVRLYDRYGNDIILAEDNNAGLGFPATPDPNNPGNYLGEPSVDPDLQTMLLVGIKPNYPI